MSPLHSIFDFDGSDTDAPVGSVSHQPLHSFVFSFAMIIISELGDKTFLIAALMAMSHPRGVVFCAAFGALLVMSVLSAALGHAVPHLSIHPLNPFVSAIALRPVSPAAVTSLCSYIISDSPVRSVSLCASSLL